MSNKPKHCIPTDASLDQKRGEITFDSKTRGKVTFPLTTVDYQAIEDEAEYQKQLEEDDDTPPS